MKSRSFGWREITIAIVGVAAIVAIAVGIALAVQSRRVPVATSPPVTIVTFVPVTALPSAEPPTGVEGPAGAGVDRALFLDLADLPAGQEDVGLAAAIAWCAEVSNTDGRIDNHGAVFERYPELDGYSGKKLIEAAVTVFCPQYASHLPGR